MALKEQQDKGIYRKEKDEEDSGETERIGKRGKEHRKQGKDRKVKGRTPDLGEDKGRQKNDGKGKGRDTGKGQGKLGANTECFGKTGWIQGNKTRTEKARLGQGRHDQDIEN